MASEVLQRVWQQGRRSLLEHEGYELLRETGIGDPPPGFLVRPTESLDATRLSQLRSSEVVLKIQSPWISHKTEAQGVRFVPNNVVEVSAALEKMISECPGVYARWLLSQPGAMPKELQGKELTELERLLRETLHGIWVVEKVRPDAVGLGTELLLGMRWTREFGMVVTTGFGGLDAEMLAERSKEGTAVVSVSPDGADGESLLQAFRTTTVYHCLSGRARGRKPLVSDAGLRDLFTAFLRLAGDCQAGHGEFSIAELEVNPWVVSEGRWVPLDLLCKLQSAPKSATARPVAKLGRLLRPATVGVVGVSGKGVNVGRIILQNLLRAGMKPEQVAIVKPAETSIDGVRCYPSMAELPGRMDLLVLAVDSAQVPDLCEQIIAGDRAESVLLIPGGMGEKEGTEHLAAALEARIQEAHRAPGGGPIFVGGNSLGLQSAPGHCDTLFIPPVKLPLPEVVSPVAFLSQSGAFMITRMSKLHMRPAYAVSFGNQTDLRLSDYLEYLKTDAEISVLAVYVEGFKDGDGRRCAEQIRQAKALGKQVILYKAGRTPEGRDATSGHTASVAGDYAVCQSVLEQAGALMAESFQEFEDLLTLALAFHAFPGPRSATPGVFITSNAGYEAVGSADRLAGSGYRLRLTDYSPATRARLKTILQEARLSDLVEVKSPLDITPMANDEVNFSVLQALLEDGGADAVVWSAVPLTRAMRTLAAGEDSLEHPQSFPNRFKTLGKLPCPVVAVVDAGPPYDAYADSLRSLGLPVFRSADRAMTALGKYLAHRALSAIPREA